MSGIFSCSVHNNLAKWVQVKWEENEDNIDYTSNSPWLRSSYASLQKSDNPTSVNGILIYTVGQATHLTVFSDT